MEANHDDLEPIDPSAARELYLDHKATHCTEATITGHSYRTRHIVDWCDENGIDTLNDLSGRNLHEFRLCTWSSSTSTSCRSVSPCVRSGSS